MKQFLDVKTIVTLSVTATFVALTLRGSLDVENFMVIATMVYTYYFTRNNQKDGDK